MKIHNEADAMSQFTRAGYPIVTIVTPVLERRLRCKQRTPGIGLVRFLGLSDEQPFAAIAVDCGCRLVQFSQQETLRKLKTCAAERPVFPTEGDLQLR